MNEIDNRKSKVKRADQNIKFFTKEIYKGVLELNKNGRLHRVIDNSKNKIIRERKRIIDLKMPNGYMRALIKIKKKNYQIYMHRLVWFWYYGELPNDAEINHKDGNKANNKIENLEMITHRENIRHAYENNLIKSKWESKSSKLTREDYERIDSLSKSKIRTIDIAKMLNISRRTVGRIKKLIKEGALEK